MTDRIHTLVACTRCARGYRLRDMVHVGDERLCANCAGREIQELRASRGRLLADIREYRAALRTE